MRVFELGTLKHRIVWGDCTSPEVQEALWGGQGEQAVDLAVTDPPYGVKLHDPSCKLAYPVYTQKIANDDREIDDLFRGFSLFSEKEPIFEVVEGGERIPRTLEEIENILSTE